MVVLVLGYALLFITDKIHIKKWTHRVQQICANEGDKTVMCGKPPLHSLIKSPSSSVIYKAFRGFARFFFIFFRCNTKVRSF